MRDNISNPPEDLPDGPQEAAEFVADVPSQPSRDISDLKPNQQPNAKTNDNRRAGQQAEAELKAALGSSEVEGNLAGNGQSKPSSQDIATGTHS
jgi:hypothetical protein